MAELPLPKEPGHVTVPEAEFRALEEKARAGERIAARVRKMEEEIRSLREGEGPSGLRRILRDILIHLDDFERAIASARRKEDYGAIIEGLESIGSGIVQALARQDVRRFSVVGDPYRPDRHEIIGEDTPTQGSKVTEEVRPGYEWRGRVFRKAWVRIT